MLDRALDRVSGHVSVALHRRAARKLPKLAESLMEAALKRWAANNWHTFDQLEVNCTAQFYRWLKDAQRADNQLSFLNVEVEHVHLTRSMIAGEQSVVGARRPDVRISIGQAGIHVECKRLRLRGAWCRDYVQRGIARFVSSSYGFGESSGMMVGYVQQDSADGLLAPVNGFVNTHSSMGSGHQLVAIRGERCVSRYLSSHVRPADDPIDLLHVWVVLGPG